jgi:very-short-patch-repair endonuclease
MIERRTASGRWKVSHPGVYVLTGSVPSWWQSLSAAVLWAGPGAVASHRAAGKLWGLDGLRSQPVEVTTTHDRRTPDVVVHRTRDLPRQDVGALHGIPVTSPARTLIDLASVLDEETLETALDNTLVRGLTSLSRLNRRLGHFGDRRQRGLGILKQLVAARDPRAAPPESVLETRLMRLIRRAGLPPPVTQFQVLDRGRVVARLDFAYPQAKVGIEADGYRYHAGKQRWQLDLHKRNALSALGWRLIVVTWEDLIQRPSQTMERIRQTLGRSLSKGIRPP